MPGPPLGSRRIGIRSSTTIQPPSFSGSISRTTLAYDFGSEGARSVPANRQTPSPESAAPAGLGASIDDGVNDGKATSERVAVPDAVADGAATDEMHDTVTSNETTHGRRRIKSPVSLLRAGFQVAIGSRYHLIDHVIAEPARREERVDLSLALGRLERLPAPELARDRSSRAV